MEGLIPFVYRAIVEYKNNNHRQAADGVLSSTWFRESPSSAAYIRLPGDSGRFQNSDIQLFMSDYSGINSAPSSSSTTATSHGMMSSGVQSPVRRRVAI